MLSLDEPHIQPNGAKVTMWKCQCDCGNIKTIMATSLKNGRTQSCGCYNKERISESNSKNLIGRKFGRLTVIKRDENRASHWFCLCDCQKNTLNPKYKSIFSGNLINGKIVSCGCYNKEQSKIQMKKMRKQYNTYDFNDNTVHVYDNTNNKIIIDRDDFDKIKDFYWYVDKKGYVVATEQKKVIKLHRFLLNITDKYQCVDHINHIKIDNRKSNLRIVSNSQNLMNHKKFSSNTSGITGVNWHKRDCVWQAQITVNNKKIYLGSFNDFEEAVKIRKQAEEKYFGKYSYDNSCNQNREELQEDIVSHGGNVASSVSSKTNYLINNDINSTSSKNQKAKSLGVPIITEEQFLEIIKGENTHGNN